MTRDSIGASAERKMHFASYMPLRPSYLGLSFAFCWVFSIQRQVPNTANGFFSPVLFLSTAMTCIFLGVASNVRRRDFTRVFPATAMITASACLVALLLLIPSKYQQINPIVLVLAGLYGISIGWFYLMWGSFYASLELRKAIPALFGSVILAAIIKTLITIFTGTLIACLICSALPIASLICWMRTAENGQAVRGTDICYTKDTILNLMMPALGVAVFSLSIGVMRSLDASFFTQSLEYDALSHLIEVVASVAIIGLVCWRKASLSFSDLWFMVLLTITAGLVLGEYAESASALSHAFLSAAQMLALSFVYLALVDVAHRSSFLSDTVFGIGWALYALPVGIGSLCMRLLMIDGDPFRVSLLAVFILMIALFLFMYGKVPYELRLFGNLDPQLLESRAGNLAQQIEKLSCRYHLTTRESDVVALYAQGRSRAYIAESLVISENTVRDHLRSVYKKMGIHNKQELLDALQD